MLGVQSRDESGDGMYPVWDGLRADCDGGNLPPPERRHSEPGPLADPPTSDQPTGEHVAAKARALADFACQHHDYDRHLSRIASAWSDIFHRPVTIREVAAALAALEILHAER